MIETVKNFLDKFNLNKPENTFLVGFSGGCDSLCLLDILNSLSKEYGFKLVAAHLNHNWRGEESLRDEKNCRKFCENLGIEYVSETLSDNIPKTENSAREERYKFFEKHAKNYPNCSIFTAHTKTDNAETLIYRIIKGTGVKGLQGILPQRHIGDLQVYRPLLNVSRQQIEGYCHSKGLVPNTDSSNFDTNYKRNFIRQKIMPLFDEINFQAENAIVSLSQIAISQTNIVEEYISQILKEVYRDKKLLTQKFKTLSEDVMLKIIYDACLKTGLEYDRKKINNILEFIKENFDSKAGSTYSLTNDLWLFANSKFIYLIDKTKAEKINDEIEIFNEGRFESPCGKHEFILKKFDDENLAQFPSEIENQAYVDLSKIGTELTLRTRREGDYIIPFGMNGSMKLKKYFNAKGVSAHLRDEIVLLCKGSEVLWAVGVGLSNKLKVENKPTHIVKLCDKIKE